LLILCHPGLACPPVEGPGIQETGIVQKIIFLLDMFVRERRVLPFIPPMLHRGHAEAAKKQFFAHFVAMFMKKISNLLDKRRFSKKINIDQQSVFYIFNLVIKEEYGHQGAENITPVFFKDKKIFIKAAGSTWASEIWLRRRYIVKKINEQLGGEEIADLAMSQ